MKTIIKDGLVYYRDRLEYMDLLIDDGNIELVNKTIENIKDANIYNASGKIVSPGFIDIHTHGAYGVDVNGATKEGFRKIGNFFAKQGTTTWLSSILTDTKEQTIKTINNAISYKKNSNNCANLLGVHLEGPFLSKEYKGAMPEHLLMKPNIELIREYQKISNGNIRYITVSPEVEGINDMISELNELGIVVAIGHSGADYKTSIDSINKGALASTHTFNAMRLFHQHEPAIMTAVLEAKNVYCEAICDGRHLHPETVKYLIELKGVNKTIAITDSIMATGLPDGEYMLGVNEIIVSDGDAKLKSNGVRAGSTLTTGTALKNIMSFTNIRFEDAIKILTINPAKLLKVDDKIGSIEEGKRADIVILDKNYNVKDTFVNGNLIK